MRGQVSIEYLMIVGFAFLMLIPLILVYYQSQADFTERITSAQADKIANEVVSAADEVFYLGPPSKKTFSIYMPGDVTSIEIANSYVLVNTRELQGAPRYSVANLSGTLSAYEGVHIIKVTAVATGVEITDADEP
jgi:uncharacterized protein (UPF0333 family)